MKVLDAKKILTDENAKAEYLASLKHFNIKDGELEGLVELGQNKLSASPEEIKHQSVQDQEPEVHDFVVTFDGELTKIEAKDFDEL